MDIDLHLRQCANNAAAYFRAKQNNEIALLLDNCEIFSSDETSNEPYYWNSTVVVEIPVEQYVRIEDRVDTISTMVAEVLRKYFNYPTYKISSVEIKPEMKPLLKWSKAYPYGKESTIELLKEEKKLLMSITSNQIQRKDSALNEQFIRLHKKISGIANSVGFNVPVPVDNLMEWYDFIQEQKEEGIALKEYMDNVYDNLIRALETSYEEADHIISDGFEGIGNRSAYLSDTVLRVTEAIASEKYTDAVMYANTAVQACLRDILKSHSIVYTGEDTNSTLYTKLIGYYDNNGQQNHNAVKLLKAATNIVVMINDIRNHNTFAHANVNLVGKREAKLALNAMSSVMGYLIEVEREL